MDQSRIDFYKPDFWCTLAVAVVVLVPLTSPGMRKWTWAAVNLAFLGILLGFPDLPHLQELLQQRALGDAAIVLGDSYLLWLCAAIVAAWIVLQAVERRWLGILPVSLAGLTVFALFVVHKLPMLAEVARLESLKHILKAIVFSYVALRLVDVLRLTHERRCPAPDLPSTVNYLLPFHMLAAGPIQGYADFVAQPAVPAPLGASDSLRAVERIATGLFKKYVLASVLEQTALTKFSAPFPYMAFEGLFYYFWLYLDFSGYSDITVGAGRLMGVATPENFNRPYVARNLVDFWNRWHMSLSQFIYRNLFVPIQVALVRRAGPKHALWCATVAFSVSFFLCGLWHELNSRWALWGAMHAGGLVTVNAYRWVLNRQLSREMLDRYLAHRGIRLMATILTQAFVASTLLVASWPQR